jgi:XTP/dITP diphosphohydrolase
MKVVVATRNPKKAKELKTLLKDLKIEIITLNGLKGTPHVKEDGRTFEENATKKAVQIAKYTKLLTLADDSGLEVEALGGAPGVFSSRFSGKNANDLKNNKKLLRLLEGVPREKRKACFTCAIAIAKRGKLLKVIIGTIRGHIANSQFGRCGFGYDPVFIPVGYKKTFAQLGPKIKNKISHRAKALRKTKRFLAKIIEKSSPDP